MRKGNAFVVIVCSFALVLQVELRAIVAAPGGSPYTSRGSSSSSGSGVDGYQGSAGLSSGLYRSSGSGVGSSSSDPSGSYYSRSYYGGYSPSSGQNDDQKETKYYYGGKYQGSCVADGLYYRDETTFVICSNGYPHEQPCPPGTKTSGSPRYQPGYYYGYTDLCAVNLVDYGYGPEYYAPRGYPELTGRELTQSAYERVGAAAGSGYGSSYGRASGSSGSIAASGRSGSTAYERTKPFAVRESEYGPDRFYAASLNGPYKGRQYDAVGSAARKDIIQSPAGSGSSDQSPFRLSTSFAGASAGHFKQPVPGTSAAAAATSSLYPQDAGSSYLPKHRSDAEYSLPKSTYLDSKFI